MFYSNKKLLDGTTYVKFKYYQFIRDGIPYLNEEQKSQLKKDLAEGILLRATERRIQNEDEDALKQGKKTESYNITLY